jgi:RimJ/RimL family protein N-acetyltransferase
VAILVDDPRWEWRGRMWCHLVSDTSYDELHKFVKQLGIPRVAFQGDHYDLHEAVRAQAVALGANPVNSREIVRALRNADLRRGPALTSGGLAAVASLPAPKLETNRLTLRQWQFADFAPCAEMESDPEVMAMLGGVRTAERSATLIHAAATQLAVTGVGRWAVEERSTGEFIGQVGLGATPDSLPFPKSLELVWRLRKQSQGRGYATEAARAVVAYSFEVLEVSETIAFTAAINEPSRAVMRRLGMTHDPSASFEHPALAPGDPLRPHVLYRIRPN